MALPLAAQESQKPSFSSPGDAAVVEGFVEIGDLGECGGCARSVARALGRVDGVARAVMTDEPVGVHVLIEEGAWVDATDLRQAVRDVGYSAASVWIRIHGALDRDHDAYRFGPEPPAPSFDVELGEGLEGAERECLGVLHFRAGPATPLLEACEPKAATID